MGVTKNTVPIGTELVVDGYQAKDGSNKAVGRELRARPTASGCSSADPPATLADR